MKILKNILTLLFVVSILFSCEKTIYIEIPDNGRRLVANSLFTADSVLKINLTKSRYILDNSSWTFDPVIDADIILYEADNEIEHLRADEAGNYMGAYILKEDKEYRIEVKAQNFSDIKAQNYIPPKTKILNLNAFETVDEYGWPEIGFNLTFKDNQDTKNYYFISARERRYSTYTNPDTGEDTTYVYDYELSVYSYDPIAFADDWYLEKGIIFNDEVINGKEYTLQFRGYKNFYDDVEEHSVYYIRFYTVTKEFYQYYISLAKHINAQDEFFMEPVQVYSNIENGFGIFAGYSTDIDSVIIQN